MLSVNNRMDFDIRTAPACVGPLRGWKTFPDGRLSDGSYVVNSLHLNGACHFETKYSSAPCIGSPLPDYGLLVSPLEHLKVLCPALRLFRRCDRSDFRAAAAPVNRPACVGNGALLGARLLGARDDLGGSCWEWSRIFCGTNLPGQTNL
jgi:hypothetical protein